MIVYLDESGDLGWVLDQPFGKGGSSRFLTLTFLFVPETKKHLPKRIVRELYNKHKWPTDIERKAHDLSHAQKILFCQKAKDLLSAHQEIQLKTITVNKAKVQEHIRKDPNLLYNYMARLCVLDHLKDYPTVRLVPDERSIRIENRMTLPNYLQTELWFSLKAKTEIIFDPGRSHQILNLQFTDFLTNCIWSHYELQKKTYFQILKPVMESKALFFS
jgi:hypothetical protein